MCACSALVYLALCSISLDLFKRLLGVRRCANCIYIQKACRVLSLLQLRVRVCRTMGDCVCVNQTFSWIQFPAATRAESLCSIISRCSYYCARSRNLAHLGPNLFGDAIRPHLRLRHNRLAPLWRSLARSPRSVASQSQVRSRRVESKLSVVCRAASEWKETARGCLKQVVAHLQETHTHRESCAPSESVEFWAELRVSGAEAGRSFVECIWAPLFHLSPTQNMQLSHFKSSQRLVKQQQS